MNQSSKRAAAACAVLHTRWMVLIEDAPHRIRVAAVVGDVSLHVTRRLVIQALRDAQEAGIRRFLIDVTA